MKISFTMSKNNATYIKKIFVMIKMKKTNLNYAKKLGIIVIIQGNVEEFLIAFVIQDIKYPKKFL